MYLCRMCQHREPAHRPDHDERGNMITTITKSAPLAASGMLMYYEFMGLSTDTKPTGETIADNSFFIELDTGTVYYKAGNNWVEFGSSADPMS